ncbi:hypothetical protein CDAR_78301 [Caerostris darwini]|uniref:Uncharacterized protein n=1 Tax=Caerostris darwini TaxID=1538125 RepID=A0AAV4SDU1_9ARAC|nr:hypothetical protein CDAR_78301 [Caerostris darwini]
MTVNVMNGSHKTFHGVCLRWATQLFARLIGLEWLNRCGSLSLHSALRFFCRKFLSSPRVDLCKKESPENEFCEIFCAAAEAVNPNVKAPFEKKTEGQRTEQFITGTAGSSTFLPLFIGHHLHFKQPPGLPGDFSCSSLSLEEKIFLSNLEGKT